MFRIAELSRSKRDAGSDTIFKFDLDEFSLDAGATLVQSALLTLHLSGPTTTVVVAGSRVCAVQVVEAEDGIHLGCAQVGDDSRATLDVSHAVQAWLMDAAADKGIRLTVDRPGVEIDIDARPPVILTETVSGLVVRQRRDIFLSSQVYAARAGRTDCSAVAANSAPRAKRCCRQSMMVRLPDLQGFEFIMQPQEFDAFYCAGRCPARYLPRNDHSLLQSLLHMKSRRDPAAKGVKKPCCSPSKFESLDILHLDELDNTRLKVTNWKNIIVGECACA